MTDFEKIHFDTRLIFAVLNGKVSSELNRKLTSDLRKEDIDLTPEQMTLLFNLYKMGQATQQELCKVTFKDKPGMTRLIDSLENAGLVTRVSDEKDRRSNIISMTPRGKAIEARAFIAANQTFKEVLEGLGQEDLILAQELLKKILSNIKMDDNP